MENQQRRNEESTKQHKHNTKAIGCIASLFCLHNLILLIPTIHYRTLMRRVQLYLDLGEITFNQFLNI